MDFAKNYHQGILDFTKIILVQAKIMMSYDSDSNLMLFRTCVILPRAHKSVKLRYLISVNKKPHSLIEKWGLISFHMLFLCLRLKQFTLALHKQHVKRGIIYSSFKQKSSKYPHYWHISDHEKLPN